ncbi:ABC transporter substrate-binding protein [Kocuria arenosa]|uniref:ABC transporter substrate-binding protein n=1 Tax=Kocuria arenosa TaxID=3071446 RepID=UPI0034D5BCF0
MALPRFPATSPFFHAPASRRTFLHSTLAVGTMGLLAGCGGTSAASSAAVKTAGGATVVRYQGSPNAVTYLELAEDLGYLEGVQLQWLGNTTSGPQDIQSVATGAADIGGAFAGAVVKLIEAGAAVTAVSNYYGSDAQTFQGLFVAADSHITTPRDLVGRSVAMNTLGAHAEAFVSTWLRRAGLSEEEIAEVTYVALPPNDTGQAITRGFVDAGVLGGIAQDVALAQGGIRELVRDTDLFGGFAGGQVVLRDDWIEANPDASTSVATGIFRAVEWATDQPRETVIARHTEIITARGRDEKLEPLKHWKSSGLTDGGRIRDEDFTRWQDWLRTTRIVEEDLDPVKYYTNAFITAAAVSGAVS